MLGNNITLAYNHQMMGDRGFDKPNVQRSVSTGEHMTVKGCENAKILAACENLAALPRAFIRFIHAGDGFYTQIDVASLKAHILAAVVAGMRQQDIDRQPAKLLKLAGLILADATRRIINSGVILSDADYCRGLGIAQSNWQRSWSGKKEAGLDAMHKLSGKAMGQVVEGLERLQTEKREA